MEHDIPFGNSNRENGTTFSDFPLFLGIFQWDEPTKRVPFTAEPEIPETLTKWKAPGISGKSTDQLDYDLECLQGISDNIPTLASHGMKFIESIEFGGLFNK